MANKLLYVGVAALFILIVLRVAFIFIRPTAGNVVAVQLTDPPQVPAGTQALVIAYSSLQVHLSNANNASGWLSATGRGRIDLLTILNLTQTIGTLQIPANASINMVRFNVSNSTIRINGTLYNVTVPSGKVTAHVTGKTTLNGTSSVLLQLSPTVASIITNTSTVFVLVPSLRAVVVPGATNSSTLRLGAKTSLTSNHTRELTRARPNVSITSASLSVSSGNVTHFSITVRDNSNSSVMILHAGFQGNLSAQFNSSSITSKINGYVSNLTSKLSSSSFCKQILNQSAASGFNATVAKRLNASVLSHLPANLTATQIAQIKAALQQGAFNEEAHASFNLSVGGARIQINASACTPAGIAQLTSRLQQIALNYSSRVQAQTKGLRSMIFGVSSTGTLIIPSSSDAVSSNIGYTLQAGQSVTLSFTGALSFGNGRYSIAPIVGANYKTGVQTNEGGIIFANVTATRG